MLFARRTVLGALAAVALVAALSAVMVPLRAHLSVASAGLVLVVPVVVGVALGGAAAGVTAVVTGFVAYDLLFIPPYGTLAVGAGQNWVALAVYAVVLAVVTAVVADQRRARADAHRREQETRRLFELSEALLSDTPDLHDRIVATVQRAFQPRWTALLVTMGDDLEVVASTGDIEAVGDLAAVRELAAAAVAGGTTVRMLDDPSAADAPVVAALVADGVPVGILAVASSPSDPHDRRLLATFANQAALAMARERLREQALRSEALEAAEHARRTLLRTVSHDLRTPLATVKASLSDLRHPEVDLPPAARAELLALAEEQADRLDRLVANLLDMTRIESGSLVLQRRAVAVADLVDEALAVGAVDRQAVVVDLDEDLPPVDADHTLLSHALVNLVENALRLSPDEVRIEAHRGRGTVQVTVSDRGPGVPPARRSELLPLGDGRPGPRPSAPHGTAPATGTWPAATPAAPGGNGPGAVPAPPAASTAAGPGGARTGLGLAIVQAFVSAHGGTIAVDDNPGGGARFTITLPVAAGAMPLEPVDGGAMPLEPVDGEATPLETADGDATALPPAVPGPDERVGAGRRVPPVASPDVRAPG